MDATKLFLDLPPGYIQRPGSNSYIWFGGKLNFVRTLKSLNVRMEEETQRLDSQTQNVEYEITRISANIYMLRVLWKSPLGDPYEELSFICGDRSESVIAYVSENYQDTIDFYGIFQRQNGNGI